METSHSNFYLIDWYPRPKKYSPRYDGYKGLFSAFLSDEKVIKWYNITFSIDRNVFNWSVSHNFDVTDIAWGIVI